MTTVTPRPGFVFSARWVLAGLGIALLGLSIAGYRAGRTPYHRDFTRFSPRISPEQSYYPTVNEMCSIVRSKCRKDQILVIVGGNSIFFGVSQPRDVMWSQRLQEYLGSEYCVVNFAFRGSSPLDGGAVIAEVLRKEYPRQIYVTNTGPLQPADPIGGGTYRFIFWEAYFKGMLEHYSPRSQRVRDYLLKEHYETRSWWELFLIAQVDRVLHFRDLWNYVSYRHVVTVLGPGNLPLKEAMAPKKIYPDDETDGRQFPFQLRFRKEVWDAEMAIVRGFSAAYYEAQPDASWTLRPLVKENFMSYVQAAMPPDLRSRTLVVLSKNAPFFLRMLSPAERARDDLSYRDSIQFWQEAGFSAMTYGEMADEDFFDRTHLMPSGGDRLAKDVSHKINQIAASLHYQSPKP